MGGLTKSFFSFSWAMTMFGLEQAGNLLSSERSGNRKERIQAGLDAVTAATEQQLGERTQKLFESGNALQREMVDLTFDVVRVDNLKPEKMLDRAADLAESAADALRDSDKKTSESGAEAPAASA